MPQYTVTTLVDDASGVAVHCTDQNLSGHTADSSCSLRDAIAAAAAVAQTTVTPVTTALMPAINFAGSYTATQNASGAALTLSGTTQGTYTLGTGGTLNIYGNINIVGPGANLLTISGAKTYRIVYLGSALTAAAISGLSFSNGSADETGGAIKSSGTLTISGCSFTDNTAPNTGGGAIAAWGTTTITASTFTGNTAFGDDFVSGGAIMNDASVLTVIDSTFSGNIITGYFNGGAISNHSGTAKIINSTFSGNKAGHDVAGNGGAIENDSYSTLLVVNSIFAGNYAGANGGAINNDNPNSGSVTESNNVFYGNTVGLHGSDVYGVTLSSTDITGVATQLATLGSYGGATQTMIPLPGSAAICAGSATLTGGAATDQRGFPRLNTTYTNYNSSTPCVDLGAVQTNYTAVAFVQQPTNTLVNTAISPSPTVTVLETNTNASAPNNTDAVNGVPITLSYSGGSGEIGGTLTEKTSGGVATFSGLKPNIPGSNFTLSVGTGGDGLEVVSGTTLHATSNGFEVTDAPAITSANHAAFTVGVSSSFTVKTTGVPVPAISESGALPAGVTLTDNGNGTATLGGIPTTGGTFNLTITASNGVSPNATQSFTLTANGPYATLSSTSRDFGTVYLYSITNTIVTVRNTGNQPLTITDPFISIVRGGDSKQFVAVNFCPRSLPAGKSCTIIITFLAGPFFNPQTATLSITDNAPGSPQTVSLTATVIDPQAQLSLTSWNFGAWKVNTTRTATPITLTNTGHTPLTINSIAIAGNNPKDFAETNNCPSSLGVKASCTINMTFKPLVKGPLSARVAITDNAQNSPQTISLTGAGN
jgi:predicted outer membrane repeat protein